ncbi:hypothetical protein HGRIS_002237 [Hohenbuehelia grisea]|uniref:Uncharacterized protein n=1 Tax=Hohenbuehelia grisea TaxID=104357 RepID=A0ABR3JL17_9AGAR
MSQPPLITLNISLSPLLSSLEPLVGEQNESLMSALLTKRTLYPLIGDERWVTDELPAKSAPSRLELVEHIPHTPHEPYRHRPNAKDTAKPPASPTTCLPSQSIIALLDLLDKFDADVSTQVARAKDNIREVTEDVKTFRHERQERLETERKRRVQEKTETKEIGSDFWAGV